MLEGFIYIADNGSFIQIYQLEPFNYWTTLLVPNSFLSEYFIEYQNVSSVECKNNWIPWKKINNVKCLLIANGDKLGCLLSVWTLS